MDTRNPGFQIAMLLILIIGYCFMLVYAFIMVAVTFVWCKRRKARQG